MEKIWLFVEGDSEENLVKHFIRNHLFTDFRLENDINVFINANDCSQHWCYCENCGSVDKVPHRINEIHYLIEQSAANHIFILCDIESLGCFTKRKEKILEILDSKIDRNKIKYTFSKPMIENHYWDCERNIISVLKKEIKNKFNRTETSISIDTNLPKNQKGLKALFKSYKVKFRESRFSDSYFARVNFEECTTQQITRLKNHFSNVIPNNT